MSPASACLRPLPVDSVVSVGGRGADEEQPTKVGPLASVSHVQRHTACSATKPFDMVLQRLRVSTLAAWRAGYQARRC